MAEEQKWKADGLGPRQIKRINDLFSKINWEHNCYVSLTRRFDGVNFYEDRTAYNDIFGTARRADLEAKMDALKDFYQATITRENLKRIESELEEILAWAKKNAPVRDERESEEVLRERHEQYAKRLEEEKKRDEEFRANSILIPEGKRGLALDICFDNSDPMTDYFDPHRCLESRLLAVIPDGREDERSLRNVIDRIPNLKEIPFEWRAEKYSMGHGNYLESKTCPERRRHPHEDRQVNCRYEITFRKGRLGRENRAIPHPEYYLGEINPAGESGGKANVGEVTLRENPELNGLEVIFPCEPEPSVIDCLKGLGFRRSFKQGLWYRRNYEGLKEKVGDALGVTA